MWYPAAVSSPATEPVSLSQAKAHLRVDHSDDDAVISGMVKVARSHIENACATRFATRASVTMKCDSFTDFSRLPEAPVSGVSFITYIDTTGTSQTLPTSIYELRADGVEVGIVLKADQTWPTIQPGSRITVVADVGYSAAPEEIGFAMLLLISQWYDNRAAVSVGETASELPFAVNALISNHRRGV